MSTVFELDTKGWEDRVADARLKPREELEAGFWDNTLGAAGAGLMRGGAKTGDFLVTMFGQSPAMSDEQERIQGIADEIQEEQMKSAVDFWTPDARTTGAAGRVTGGLAEMAIPLVAGAGNPTLLVGSQTLAGGKRLVDEGADATTAGIGAAIEGTATAAGAALPAAFGKTLAQRMLTGAAANTGVNMGATLAEHKLLEARGYEDLAKSYDPLDMEARSIDLLLGAAFGGIAHVAAVRMPPSARNAVLATANAKHFQQDTAPGRPLDAAASVAHQRAMETAMQQVLRDEPVSVPPEVMRANFEARMTRMDSAEEAWRDVFGNDPPKAPEPVSVEPVRAIADDATIEERFSKQIKKDLDAAMRQYAALSDSKGGKVINADLVRELSPDYLADRSRAGAVHEPASMLTKEIFKRALAESKPGGEVVFAAGGAGSGKSVGLNALGIENQIVYDGTLSKFENAKKLIDQALDAKQTARIVYTYRDPAEAFKKGALSRSMREERDFGTGRTVPIAAFVEGHKGARETLGKLMEHYGKDERVKFTIFDNSRGPGEARMVELADLPQRDYNGLREELLPILEEQRSSGAISEPVYRGTRGQDDAGRVRAEGSEQPEQGRSGKPSDEVGAERYTSPTIEAVRDLLAQRDVPIATGEIDANGNAVVRSGREVMAEAEAAIAKAKQDGKGIEAAVNCFLTRGTDAA